ncbi:amino acid ABC transporter membrane protein, PAAT family [Pseudorhodobacter antarcticus]|uniref:Amino acid ABC transporter membrane protein, PAAT family n=1 Tax=Pseudorhodobacter antarcticus TaxID=1077947 RepID=A0A1H8B040_9RHOB|nr:amino acid ABC transporter permease [Pseudorhodobacter antarcticus]SEM76322.1 amino acid ABC transporter membrane protein, PAAT family [Pseudorhodobacter antarcticus]
MLPAPDSKDFPYWLLILIGVGGYLFWEVLSDDLYSQVLSTLSKGIWTTIMVTVVAFTSAAVLGLVLAVAAGSRFMVLRQTARLYTEIVRGVPIIVLLLYVAFVLAPAMVALWNWATAPLGFDPIRNRDFPLLWRAVIALTIAYSAFLAEVFRAGLASVDKGQTEAAQALGLSRWHTFRLVVFPQGFRVILPPLGNDFIAMVKDSSLVSVLGVIDITQLGKVTAAGNFKYFETYNVVALVYLTMTITLSIALRQLEKGLRQRQER